MKNGCTLAALISAMLNVINEVLQQTVSAVPDYAHTAVAIILAIATLIAIWRIDTRRNNHGERR
jgi:spore maturation protein SpmA